MKPDLTDAHVYGGAILCALSSGIATTWPPALGGVVLGFAIFWLGVRRPRQ